MAWIYKPKQKRKNNQKKKERQEIYSSRMWKKLRLEKLRQNPICEICELENKSNLAIDVHHLKSFLNANDEYEKEELAFDINNLLSVCKMHHSLIHNGYLKDCFNLDQIKKRIKENNNI